METIPAESLDNLLEILNLSIQVEFNGKNFFAVRNVNFKINQGETFALVGESGSGKTMIALSILGLLPGCAKQISGKMVYKNRPVSKGFEFFSEQLRGKHIAMIFQNATSALNPVFRIGTQMKNVIRTHLQLSSIDAEQKIFTLFNQVGLLDAQQIYRSYPHQLSGGMAQRVMIAMALSCNPELIIADEPTTALDVTTQMIILKLISKLQKECGFSLMLISHDLKLVSIMADRIAVMRKGKIIESNKTADLFSAPQNRYTKQLIATTR